MKRLLFVAVVAMLFTSHALAVTFSVELDTSLPPSSGRLVVFLGAGAKGDPPESFDEFDPHPLFGTDVKDLAPRASVTVDDTATAFPGPLSQLPPGDYRAIAVLMVKREHSSWQSDPGNLFSEQTAFTVGANDARSISIKLTKIVQPRAWPKDGGADLVEVRSKLLSDFYHRDVFVRAGVVHPPDEDPNRLYAAVYDIPGFGGDHFRALKSPDTHSLIDESPSAKTLWRSAFHIVPDPESPNGHTMFLNSDNNGPRGDALVHELIPELERRYHLTPKPEARLLRGHSSGGGATMLLAMDYPETFGATWSASPDPIDFRHFQRCDLYGENMYTGTIGEIPSVRAADRVTLSVRQENAVEEVLGPGNTSAQQWDSWQAVFGHRLPDGGIAPLYDAKTGKLDAAEAGYWRRYDLLDRLQRKPQKYLPMFRDRVHLIVGDRDNYFLNEAVVGVKAEFDRLGGAAGGEGYVKIVPGRDHTTIYASDEMAAIPKEMLNWLHTHGMQ